MVPNKDILDAPEPKVPGKRVFTIVGLVGALVMAGSTVLINYYMDSFTGRFQSLAFLNVPEWVIITFMGGGLILLVGIIGSFIRREPGGVLRWFVLIAGGAMLFLLISFFAE